MSNKSEPAPDTTVRATWALTLASLVPFFVLAAALAYLGKENALFFPLLDAFKTGAAIALSFLGGIRWGLALTQAASVRRDLVLAILPPLLGWACLFMPDPLSIAILLLGFAAQGAWDSISAQRTGMPLWFARLRALATLIIAGIHMVVFFAAY